MNLFLTAAKFDTMNTYIFLNNTNCILYTEIFNKLKVNEP